MKEDLDINSINRYIGANIKKIREYRKLTTSDLANKVNVTDGAIRNIESGKSLSLQLLVLISLALEVQIDTLLYDFVYHVPEAKNGNMVTELFIETYNSVSEREKKILEHILLSFKTENGE